MNALRRGAVGVSYAEAFIPIRILR